MAILIRWHPALPTPDTLMARERSFFYGWFLIPVLWVIYGFGIAPAAVGLGILAIDMTEDMGLLPKDIGAVRGLRVLLMSLVAPAVGIALGRWGSRRVMTVGSFVAAIGFFSMSRAEGLPGLFIGYSVISGLAMGFSTILPTQNLTQLWFKRYRARAMGIILTAGGLVGSLTTLTLGYMLKNDLGGWRQGWASIGAVSFVVGFTILAFVRDSPASIGQEQDGGPAPASGNTEGIPDGVTDGVTEGVTEGAEKAAEPLAVKQRHWTAAQAIRTPQFVLLTLTGIAYSGPWGAVMTYAGLHLRGLEFDIETIGYILAALSFMSIFGRFAGAVGDFVSPQLLLGLGLALEALGLGGFGLIETKAGAFACLSICGLGFGAAYTSTPVVFSNFFGPVAFATATGTRFFIGGLVNAAVPYAVGVAAEASNSYTPSFLVLGGYGLIAALIAVFCPKPGEPPEPPGEKETATQ